MTIQEIRRDAIINILKDVEFPVIVEAGACHGEDSQMLNCAAQSNNVVHILIEPDFENFAVLQKNTANIRGRQLIKGAVSNANDLRKFNRSIERKTGYRFCGSLMKPREDVFPQMDFDGVTDVQCYTLDSIFEIGRLTHIDLLWADVQGAEREMIQGGRTVLSKTRYLFIEVVEREEYIDQALKSELISMLDGWSIIADFDGDVLMKNERYEG